jgi:hypothetical protein
VLLVSSLCLVVLQVHTRVIELVWYGVALKNERVSAAIIKVVCKVFQYDTDQVLE